MASEYQTMPSIIHQMRQAKKKAVYSSASQATDLNAFANRGFTAGYLDALYQGRNQPNPDTIDVFTSYLLKRFYQYNSS